jgi:hypothetical protein
MYVHSTVVRKAGVKDLYYLHTIDVEGGKKDRLNKVQVNV